jgi:signal transduction histidine kinase
MKHLRLSEVLQTLEPGTAVIFCADSEHADSQSLRKRFPKLLQVPLREDWAQMVLVLAGESLRRTEALKIAKQAERNAALNANQAMLGRYMIDMKHNLNNALTSLLGNAELLLLEPGQLSTQSLAQIKTMHTMALRINEIMQRFSSLAAEMRDAETPSQPETEYQRLPQFTQR